MKNKEKVEEILRSELFEKLSRVERRYLVSFIEGMVASAELRSNDKPEETA